MTIEILMPAVGAGVTQGKILQWCKSIGDKVTAGDILAEIETDKAVIELEAFDEGVLQEILVEAGSDDVPVGHPVAILASNEAGGDAPQAAVQAPAQRTPQASASVSEPPAAAPPVHRPAYFASPSARRLARELDVDIAQLEGSGPGGRIVRVDIERAANSTARQTAAASSQGSILAAAPSPAQSNIPAAAPSPVQGNVATTALQRTTIPHSNMRRTIARRLQEAKQNIPHFYLSLDCKMDNLLAMRKQVNAHRDLASRFSVNDILVYATARAVAKVPAINRQWSPDALIQNDSVDISVAVATDAGLFTPVVRNADKLGLFDVSTELSRLIDKARNGRLKPDEYEGGSLTVSNLGMFGIKEFSAIINPPQAAILAMGSVSPQPVVEDGELTVAQLMNITLSADHRVVDGAVAARFLKQLKTFLETPYLLLT